MPKGPRGEKRPADAIGRAIMVAKIATGEIEDNPTPADKVHHSRGGKKGGDDVQEVGQNIMQRCMTRG